MEVSELRLSHHTPAWATEQDSVLMIIIIIIIIINILEKESLCDEFVDAKDQQKLIPEQDVDTK